MSFSQVILLWYFKNKRALPWRASRDPYRIWLSEIILQQTRVLQGTPYYLKFLKNFPTVEDLASASEEKVLKLWQGLGYYSRARNLHATAQWIAAEYDGKFPNTYSELLKLKGVGDYTASAIASICFDAPEPVVDGNVYRVLSRYFGVELPIDSSKGIAYFKQLAKQLMDIENISDYNQGIMEFGAIQCSPKKPDCLSCPLNNSCVSLQENRVEALPVKINKTKIKNRYFNYLVFLNQAEKTVLYQRKGKGIWQNLWEFPLLETAEEIDIEELRRRLPKAIRLNDTPEIYQYNERVIVYKLSHQHLYTKFWIVKTDTELEDGIVLADLDNYPVPVLISDFIKTFKNSYF